MLRRLRQRAGTESAEIQVTVGEQPKTKAVAHEPLFRLGRLIYGGILAFMAVDGLWNAEERTAYAKAKRVPVPGVTNYLSHGLLLGGGIGVALWRAPTPAASAVAMFFLGVASQMHDFWAIDDPEQKQQKLVYFLKNTALLGTALFLLGIARKNR